MNAVLIIYPFFKPAQRAGGIVSSLYHLTNNLPQVKFDIYTSAFDLDGTPLNVMPNCWITQSQNCRVWYDNGTATFNLSLQMATNGYRSIYINGIYGWKYFLRPLITLQFGRNMTKPTIIIAPRGMVQQGSLQIKPLKKKLYFVALKASRLLKGVRWHATDDQEVLDISHLFRNCRIIKAIDSPPTNPMYAAIAPTKKQGALKLVFLSLLTAKKNLLFLLNLIDNNPTLDIELDIYGPIKDHDYWERCLAIINKNASRVRYKGEVQTNDIAQTLKPYDVFVLPTLGENFGHVIFEALVAGKPVLITPFTPWKKLQENNCGAALPLDEKLWLRTLVQYLEMDESLHLEQCRRAQHYVQAFLSSIDFDAEYRPLFS